MNNVAIVPARGGSKRIPRKNIKPLRGKPLLAYTLETALESGVFDEVCVTSDDGEILSVAENHGATILNERPDRLATDEAQVKEVCHYLLEDYFEANGYHFDAFCVLLTTNPLRTPELVADAYSFFRDRDPAQVMSLVEFHHPPQRAVYLEDDKVRLFCDESKMVQTQKLKSLYRHDGSFIFDRVEQFLDRPEFYREDTCGYPVPPDQSVDIDEPIDLKWAEFLLAEKENE